MSLTRMVLRFAAPLPKLEQFQRYLFIGPHPDDIEIGAGATAAKLAAAGKEICFLICTDGRYGGGHVPELSPLELAELRRNEARRSAAALSISDVRFLDLEDGGFYDLADLKQKLAFHHLACLAPYSGIMARYGTDNAPVQALAFYMTAKPNSYVKTTGFFDKQLKAIFNCHGSQFPAGSPEQKAISAYLKLRACDFGLRSLKGCAEGFRVLGPTQMHCLPEAGN